MLAFERPIRVTQNTYFSSTSSLASSSLGLLPQEGALWLLLLSYSVKFSKNSFLSLHCFSVSRQFAVISWQYLLLTAYCFLLTDPQVVPLSNFGGDERDRTADPLLARQVLSQLSYTPTF